MIRTLAAVIFALAVAADEPPRLVYDFPGVNTQSSFDEVGNPFWISSGNLTWFIASPSRNTAEIFRTDGTPAGTVQLTFGKGSPDRSWRGPFLGAVNGKLVYGGSDGVYALNMNGGVPVLLADVFPVDLKNGVVVDGSLYFVAPVSWRGVYEWRIWRTDGTPAGTEVLGIASDVYERRLYLAGGRIFFFGKSLLGAGLHATRGTSVTTTFLYPFDGYRVSANLFDTGVRTLGDRLLFSFSSPSELWSTDGTGAGTRRLAEYEFHPFGVVAGRLFFSGPQTALYSTDGTPEGTADTGIVSTGTDLYGPYFGAVAANRMFFYVKRTSGITLYVTEGSAATTRAVMSTMDSDDLPGGGFVLGNDFYFVHQDAAHGRELWRTDGTEPPVVIDLNPGARGSIGYQLKVEVRADGTALFAATHHEFGAEPWITDGTAEGTRLVANLAADDWTGFSGNPRNVRASGSRVFFFASTSGGEVAGVSDGRRISTTIASPEYPAVAANGRFFFRNSSRLFVYDGTSITTLTDKATDPVAVPGGVVFARRVSNGGHDLGEEVVFSDGTLAGTRVIRAVTPVPSYFGMTAARERAWFESAKHFWVTDGHEPVEIAPAEELIGSLHAAITAGRLDFLIERSSNDQTRLWRSDRTSAGTRILMSVQPLELFLAFIGATDRHLFFDSGPHVYATDGTSVLALPIAEPGCGSAASLGDVLFFATQSAESWTLWRSDGTPAGTAKLMTFNDDRCPAMATFEERVYFPGNDAAHGTELWVTDGTTTGTRLYADLEPGAESSRPSELTTAEGRLFFSAATSIGRELWVLGGPERSKRRATR